MSELKLNENVLARFRLDGKTAVVTGAAGNIGYHTARAFAQAAIRSGDEK